MVIFLIKQGQKKLLGFVSGEGGGGGGCARSVNFVQFSDSARVLQHCSDYHLSSVGSFHQHHGFHQTGKLDSINRGRFRTIP